MPALYYEGKEIPYEIIKSKRKTIGLSVNVTGEVKVRVPMHTAADIIEQLVEEKAGWITEKRQQFEKERMRQPIRQFCSGEQLLYFGRPVILKVIIHSAQEKPEAVLQDEILTVRTADKEKLFVRDIVDKWYRKEAEKFLGQRVLLYQPLIGRTCQKISCRDTKTRWGSCSRKGNIMFQYKIIMAPVAIIDYVVVHELCHLRHMDHSPEFWDEVKRILPDYRERKRWLKENGVLLSF